MDLWIRSQDKSRLIKILTGVKYFKCCGDEHHIEDIDMETAVKAGIDAAEKTRDTYRTSASYDYPYTVMEINGNKVVEVELAEDENAEYVFTDIDDNSEFKISGKELKEKGFSIEIKEKRTAKIFKYKANI